MASCEYLSRPNRKKWGIPAIYIAAVKVPSALSIRTKHASAACRIPSQGPYDILEKFCTFKNVVCRRILQISGVRVK